MQQATAFGSVHMSGNVERESKPRRFNRSMLASTIEAMQQELVQRRWECYSSEEAVMPFICR